ncbi:heavy metal translocating P-type ATPase [Pseudonocardia petroleophila]|uniref:Heavy metal translocating P-type ATPase n=1 Tax=Pseudonocardia petroleophila TaxID=37331 RepID=A0A7G7MGP2_9PSEU|nr:heavy metal translocating P-type ATPase [Pseudonocardia petroleophila]QNG51953.1 heavy metal translocating P-type ATPase [Pseudonocardia petroleophila]
MRNAGTPGGRQGAPASVTLDLQELLPEALQGADGIGKADRCVGRLSGDLAAAAGVEDAHVLEADAGPARLCVHYDPARAGHQGLQDLARRTAAELAARYGHLRWQARDGGADPGRLAARIERIPGVVEVTTGAGGALHVEFDRRRVTAEELAEALAEPETLERPGSGTNVEQAGPAQTGHEPGLGPDRHDRDEDAGHGHGHGHGHGGIFGERSELIFAGLSGLLLLAGWVMAAFLDTPRPAELAVYSAAFFFGAYYTVQEAYRSVRARRFEIDFLMLVAAAGAAVLGEVAEGALLLFLFSIGHALEGYAMGRARRAIEALAEIAPKTALVRRDGTGEAVEVPVEQLRIGDVVVVRPNLRLPADGFVIAGTSSVDQAPVTGESVPVDKAPVPDVAAAAAAPDRVDAGSRVFAGTINGSGVLEVQVTRLATDSTMARVVRLVTEAQTKTSPTQRFTDRFQKIFVPAVLGTVFALLFAGLVIDEPFSATLYRALAVLVAASPCALAIATPSAVLSAVARAARAGVLVKGGAPLEELGRLNAIAFDKTGTLTRGRPRIADVVAAAGVTEAELLAVAIAVEEQSDHPLARAVVRDGRERLDRTTPVPRAQNVRAVTGQGVLAEVDGVQVGVGRRALFPADGPALPAELDRAVTRLEDTGRTTMLVRAGNRWLGAIGLMDLPRPEAATVIDRLHRLGIRNTVMLSGDNQRVADAIAADVGVDHARGGLMPEDKVTEIDRLRASAGRVAMVGDGVNDAPAMATATVGIAMGAAGSDVALETADIALMADDLTALPVAVGLSRRASRIIAQNLWASLGVVAVLIPATILGLGIGPAVLIHEGSTLIVVANALRLLAYRDRT